MKCFYLAVTLTTITVVVAKLVLQENITSFRIPVLNDSLYEYPTDFTQGIVPKPIHSHNDYWRDVPFFTALSYGCISTEADVWLYNGTLYVGHMRSALTHERTFQALYVRPILKTVQNQNPKSDFVSIPTKNGVFDTDPTQTLYLFVDLKTDGETTLPFVSQELQPLRDAGYLTTFNGTNMNYGPVTVIGTGNTPLYMVQDNSERDIFFDAQLQELDSSQGNVTADVSPIASTDFIASLGGSINTTFSSNQLGVVQRLIAHASDKGIGARFWNTPAWPISIRNEVWKTLTEQGVALLNADDVAAAAGFAGSPAW